MSFVIKIRYNDDTRRISLGMKCIVFFRDHLLTCATEKAPAYQELVHLATQLFGIVPACFQYQDDEEDIITVTNDLELREAVTVSVKSKSILRVFVIGMCLNTPLSIFRTTSYHFVLPRTTLHITSNSFSYTFL